MKVYLAILAFSILGIVPVTFASGDVDRDILVTFHDDAASPVSGSIRAPYRARQRYSISASARRNATAIAREYDLETVEHWPIRSLGVYCYVYRPNAGTDREALIDRLSADERVESVQPLNEFRTGTASYNDELIPLQRSLALIDLNTAHTLTRGKGVRIAIIDSAADGDHEDLDGQLERIVDFAADDVRDDLSHGTAVASVIAANTNNGKGIAGIAPEASVDLLVACWKSVGDSAVCDSFSLARALDALFADPPDIVNMSLVGPEDPLLARLIETLHDQGVVIIAAGSAKGAPATFPATSKSVIGVNSAAERNNDPAPTIRAPGEQIMVAIPGNNYDFRSGSSLAAAHVSGVAALILSVNPELTPAEIGRTLASSQRSNSGLTSINACVALNLNKTCVQAEFSKLNSGAQ